MGSRSMADGGELDWRFGGKSEGRRARLGAVILRSGLSGLTQREYCERHGPSLKSFGNWRAQLKREDTVGSDAR